MRRPHAPLHWDIPSILPLEAWPGVPTSEAAEVLGLLFQLERTQWLSAGRLLAAQERQLDVLLGHAHATVPYYRERWGAAPQAADLQVLPILARRELQDNFDALRSASVPLQHGPVVESRTSGSTGAPVRVLKTALQQVFWRALTLREHRWHRRDVSATLAVIRKGAGRGSRPSWGPATQDVVQTGACLTLDVDVDVASQLEWLRRHDPEYLLTYPSIVAELARLSLRAGIRLGRLREVRTFGEALGEDTAALCREAWGVPLVDFYSSEEVGYMALQCPEHGHYHVQSESTLIEVLGEDGRPCAPGQPGRVVVTDLHNFAMPIIRYDIGDYAEAGTPCACGRGLPVLRRIAGRVRNLLVTRSGRRYWQGLGLRALTDEVPVLQYRAVQKSLDLVELHCVLARPLSVPEEALLVSRITSHLPEGIQVRIAPCRELPRGPGGKYEDFVSEVALSGAARSP